MKEIKVKFVDFWRGFDAENNFITDSLTNYKIVVSEEPEYLFYSCFGQEHLKYDCIRIFYTGENLIPDFNLCDYGIGFARMDFADRYIRFPLYCLYTDDVEKMLEKHKVKDSYLKEKTEFCAFVVSDSELADPRRNYFFELLSGYKKVNSGGTVLNNIGGGTQTWKKRRKTHFPVTA